MGACRPLRMEGGVHLHLHCSISACEEWRRG